MFKKLHLTPATLRFGLSSGPPINFRTPPPDNYCTVPKIRTGRWTMDYGRWTMDDGRWTVDGGLWIFSWSRNKPLRDVTDKTHALRDISCCLFSIFTIASNCVTQSITSWLSRREISSAITLVLLNKERPVLATTSFPGSSL